MFRRRPRFRRTERRIRFPWEVRGTWWRVLSVRRARPVVIALVTLLLVALIGLRERRLAGVRQTRATLLDANEAVQAFMAHHEGRCPESLAEVVPYGAFDRPPLDAWGRPLRLRCPAREEGKPFEIYSDGPDGEPGGLDRIE